MVILGIDPGIATVGFGIVESHRSRCRAIQYGVLSTPAGLPLSRRLTMIYEDMQELIHTFHPDEMAVEELFFNTNLTTGIAVAHGRGVILLAAEQLGVPIFEYTPMQVKGLLLLTNDGALTQRLLHLTKLPRPDDAADALAIALCHSRTATSLIDTDRVFDAKKYDTR